MSDSVSNLFSGLYAEKSPGEKQFSVVYRNDSADCASFRRRVMLLAGDLLAAGVRAGDKVALWSFNSTDYLAAVFAIVRIGAVAVLANYSLPSAQLVPVLGICGASFLVFGPNRDSLRDPDAGAKLAEALGIPGRFLSLPSAALAERAASDEALPVLPEEDTDDGRTAVIIFTTGTTAVPKAVMLSQRSIVYNARSWFRHVSPCFDKEKLCIALPFFHSYGLSVAVGSLLFGKRIYLPVSLKSEEIADLISANRINYIGSISSILLEMASSPRFAEEIVPCLDFFCVGGGYTSPEHIRNLDSRYPGFRVIIGYGQSEASPVISVVRPDDSLEKRACSVGRPIGGITVMIDGPSGKTAEPGVTGEILVKGPTLMNGYYGIPPEEQPIDSEGWLHTQDLGHIDEDGYLVVSGRIKDIIIKNGENISPAEIEDEILRLGGVKDVKVIGTESSRTGERISACLVLSKGHRFDEEAFRQRLQERLSRFKIPENFFTFEAFPMTENGKVDVCALRERVREKLSARHGR